MSAHDDVLRSTPETAPSLLPAAAFEPLELSPATTRYRELSALQSLLWLVVGCFAGLVLATLLVAPWTGEMLGPVTYGRIVPVHFDTQLYGWLSIPLVGLLLHFFFGDRPSPLPAVAINAWSAGLAWGVVTWLTGHSSGKLFLEWTGSARVVMTLAMTILWLVLAAGLYLGRTGSSKGVFAAKAALVALLAPVSWTMWHATSATVYPPINPDSGGATGGSLLGSTLGIIAVILLIPFLAGRDMKPDGRRAAAWIGGALVVHSLLFGVLDHGDRSHHEMTQIAAILSLGVWIPLLVRFVRAFDWKVSAKRWMISLASWGTLLWLTAAITFMPGVLERLKFTNGLVAHAHLAMAGFTNSLVVIVLVVLLRGTRLQSVFEDADAFRDWHLGLVLMFGSLSAVGILEGEQRGVLFTHDPVVTTLYLVRWIAGFLMLLAALRWTATAFRALTTEAAE